MPLYHGNAKSTTVGIWYDVYELIHKEATRTGWSATEITNMIIQDFFESGREMPFKKHTRPRLSDFMERD